MQALMFDVDGTRADTEAAHRQAFNAAFAETGLDWVWDEALYTRLLKVAGGKERLMHYWRIADPEEAGGARVQEVIDALHAIKTRRYAERVRGRDVPLRPGIARLIAEAAAAGLPVAIATTTAPAKPRRTAAGAVRSTLARALCGDLRREHHAGEETRARRLPRGAVEAGFERC